MSRKMIYLDDAIDVVKEWIDAFRWSGHKESASDAAMILKDIGELQPAQPEQRWIPVEKRLPEGIGQVIIQANGGAIHEVFYKGKNYSGHEVWIRLDGAIYWDDEVVAWMPLPEPFQLKEE